jgi:hypothetical protein
MRLVGMQGTLARLHDCVLDGLAIKHVNPVIETCYAS